MQTTINFKHARAMVNGVRRKVCNQLYETATRGDL